MGCTGSKKASRAPAGCEGQIKRRKMKESVPSYPRVAKDAVRQARPTRFFNVTQTSVVATIAVDRKSIIRAYMEPDGGDAPTQGIEVECEADVDHYVLYDNLEPGTLYRLKLFYVAPESRHLGNMLTAMLQGTPTHSKDTDAMQGTALGVRRSWTARVHQSDVSGRRKTIQGVEVYPGMKHVAMLPNYAHKAEVRTLRAERASYHLVNQPPSSFWQYI
ncbi:conserved hypothetical protein [Neospora caninum Liverpool]|uniref:Uncharacterized protein n=1 Tax=Neospora caninum (strain Liverpool) TaxID=572307 RepID=F0VKA9_NEOCL|nr:conserved hypothetical protein [Neospora caninum Liverpool]CBZ54510.1 conserved hypothetical protein [Neospora caninum Liverpool]CEL69223.1 TPA: hypothetical protein BN1204_049390 [Neospora caninum Liverpool]|eukprot:XP_003884540.1 conserved hypothetical protein [Neospora caninum Liverpool]